MTQLQSGQFLSIQYSFHATQNNGKIISETQSGETVTYQYDSLNRLSSAESSLNPGWGQSFAYDGFGNLTQVNVTKGTAPSLSASYAPATNRRTGECADANGNLGACGSDPNLTYDVLNRLAVAKISGGGTERYAYAPNNQRVWRGVFFVNQGFVTQTVNEITFYAPGGAKLAMYRLPLAGYSTSSSFYEYFGGKMIRNAQGWVNQDRLGSIGKYFPYGQERPSATAEGTEKFATYFRDENTGLDYAQNRYHKPGEGRFMSPDPYLASGGPGDPGSWNRYAYVAGDPVNRFDPSGLLYACPNGDGCQPTFPSPANCTYEFWKAECGENNVSYCPDPTACVIAGISEDTEEMAELPTSNQGVTRSFGTSFSTALGIAKKAAATIALQKSWKPACEQLMGSLGTTIAAIQAAATRVTFHDGIVSTDLYASLHGNTPQAAAAMAQYGAMTVAAYFAAPLGVNPKTGNPIWAKAAADRLGNRVFLNSTFWGGNHSVDMTTVMHELIHNATGLTDDDFARIVIGDFSSVLQNSCF